MRPFTRVGKHGGWGTVRAHRFAEALMRGPDQSFTWLHWGRFNLIIDRDKKEE